MQPTLSLTAKRVLLGSAAAVILLAFLWALWPKAVAVETAAIDTGDLLVTVDEEGKTRIKDVYTVSAPITGKVVRIMLEAGDNVKKEQSIIASIEPMAPPFLDVRALRELDAQIEAGKAALALAQAEVRQASAELEFAESELRRAEELIRTKAIPERSLERARIDVDTRKAALARAKANADVRQRELESTQARTTPPEDAWKGEVPAGCCVNVRAPISGKVLRVLQESERVVTVGTPLLEIGDPANLEIVVDLLSADAVKVRDGATATLESWGGPPIKAHVTRVEPAGFTKVSALGIEEQRVRTILKLSETPPLALRLGHEYRVIAKIGVYQAPDALRVPIAALFRNKDQWSVFQADRGRARMVPIEIGQRNADFAEVRGGLAPGMAVVLHPSDRVVHGTRIAAMRGQ